MSDDVTGGDQTGGEQVGSVGEEAAKLLGALADWARDQGAEVGGGLGAAAAGLAGQAAAAAKEVDAHLATGAPECRWCPVCRAVHAVRSCAPEVREQLLVAADALVKAAAGFLATQVPEGARDAVPPSGPAPRGHGPRPPQPSGVERIDLDPDDPDDTDRQDQD